MRLSLLLHAALLRNLRVACVCKPLRLRLEPDFLDAGNAGLVFAIGGDEIGAVEAFADITRFEEIRRVSSCDGDSESRITYTRWRVDRQYE